MDVFRVCREKLADRLTASKTANRWNKKGQKVIYTSGSRALAAFELAVHTNVIVPKTHYKVMVISIADDHRLIKSVSVSELPLDWRSLSAYPTLQHFGSEWYRSQESLILKVPSAVICQEYNYIINTEHPDFASKVQLVRTEDYFWDNRLL